MEVTKWLKPSEIRPGWQLVQRARNASGPSVDVFGAGRISHHSQNTFTTTATAVNAITKEIQNSADGSHVALSGFLRTGFSLRNCDPRPRSALQI